MAKSSVPEDKNTFEELRDQAFVGLEKLVEKISQGGAQAEEQAAGSSVSDMKMEVLRKQQEVIDRIVTGTKVRATVISVIKPSPTKESDVSKEGSEKADSRYTAVVAYQGQQLEVLVPDHMEVGAGDVVSLLSSTMQPVGLSAGPLHIGEIAAVSRLIDEGKSEISIHGFKRVVLNGSLRGQLEVGDRVVVDDASVVILDNLGKTDGEFQFLGDTRVTEESIIGCKDAKEKLRDALQLPYDRPDILEHYNDKPPAGILLIGLPGNGKTLLLKFAVAIHRTKHGAQSLVIYVKGAELLRGIVGETEERIRYIFEAFRSHFKKTGIRGLLVIDEAEALLRQRGSGKSSDVESTNVPTFLAEMDGLESTGNPIVLLATNRPDMLDDAIMRDERMDEIISIPPPAKEEVHLFFELYFKNVPLEADIHEMAKFAADEFLSPDYALAKVTRKSTGAAQPFTLAHLVNGAMLAGIARRAKGSARRRDVANTKKGEQLGAVTKEDIRAGIRDAFLKSRHLNFGKAFLEFAQGFNNDIAQVDDPQKMFSR